MGEDNWMLEWLGKPIVLEICFDRGLTVRESASCVGTRINLWQGVLVFGRLMLQDAVYFSTQGSRLDLHCASKNKQLVETFKGSVCEDQNMCIKRVSAFAKHTHVNIWDLLELWFGKGSSKHRVLVHWHTWATELQKVPLLLDVWATVNEPSSPADVIQ